MLAPWQTEWCPASSRIRRRLTELGIDFVTRRVPLDTDERTALRQAIGCDAIPALVLGNSRPAR
jgi:glutaredoxin